MSRVYLVRHAVHALVGKALAGRQPGVHLSDQGRGEAGRLAARLGAADVASILSSPLERCRETAQPMAEQYGLAVAIEHDLNEIDCGVWTGESFETLEDDARWHSWNDERSRNGTPGGETVHEVQVRVMRVLDRLVEQDGGPAVLVTHSDVIKVAVLSLLGGSLDMHHRLVIDPASITSLDLWRGGGKVLRLNEEAVH